MMPSFTTPPLPDTPRSRRALLGDALRRPGGRRGLSVLSLVLLVAGLGMFAYPNGTDAYSAIRQDRLKARFDNPAVAKAYKKREVPVGEGLTRLQLPKIGLDVLVVQGTTPDALRAGAGHYKDTPLPGEAGNVGIAGHRTTYGRPFNRLDEMHAGDVAVLETPLGVYTYKAVGAFSGHANPWVVVPTDISVVDQDKKAHQLTLTTCNPKGSARQRLVMRFTLMKSQPRPAKA